MNSIQLIFYVDIYLYNCQVDEETELYPHTHTLQMKRRMFANEPKIDAQFTVNRKCGFSFILCVCFVKYINFSFISKRENVWTKHKHMNWHNKNKNRLIFRPNIIFDF